MRRKYAVIDIPDNTADNDIITYDAATDLWTASAPTGPDHDHTAPGDGGVLTNDAHDGYTDMADIATPAAPAANVLRLYSKDIHDHPFLSIIQPDGDEMSLGQDMFVAARNNTGLTITAGTPVYISGATGNIPNIAPADASAHATMLAIGLLQEQLLDTETGLVRTAGVLTFDTSGPGWSLGDEIYVSETTGALTNVAPAFPAIQQHVAYVSVVGVGNGKLLLYGGDTHEQVDHADLANVTADQHHVKYTDGEVDAIVATHAALAGAHHARSHDHSNASDGTALAPVTVDATGAITAGGNITADGNLKAQPSGSGDTPGKLNLYNPFTSATTGTIGGHLQCWCVDAGAVYRNVATIRGEVSNHVGSDDISGRLIFATRIAGAAGPITDHWLISSTGVLRPVTDNVVTFGNSSIRPSDTFLRNLDILAGSTITGIDHSDIANVGVSDHHVKYTDAEVDAIVATHTAIAGAHHAKYLDSEAIAAVEGESTLVLTGALTGVTDPTTGAGVGDRDYNDARYVSGQRALVKRGRTASNWNVADAVGEYNPAFDGTPVSVGDVATYFDTTTNAAEIRVLVAGAYRITVQTRWDSNGSTGRMEVRWGLNAAANTDDGITTPHTNHTFRLGFTTVAELSADDDISIYAFHNAGSNMIISDCYLTVEWIG